MSYAAEFRINLPDTCLDKQYTLGIIAITFGEAAARLPPYGSTNGSRAVSQRKHLRRNALKVSLSLDSVDDYRLFLKIKSLPQYRIHGRLAEFPDEYAHRLGIDTETAPIADYEPIPVAFDYQRDIAAMAIEKKRFAAFIECGFGKTILLLEFARHWWEQNRKERHLIVSPLMVVEQTIGEAVKFYGDDLPIDQIPAKDLPGWLREGKGIGITNYEAMNDKLPRGTIDTLIGDETSMMKSDNGKWGNAMIRLGRGVPHKLACTGTPAPNDRVEFANHAVFVDAFPSRDSFKAKYFVNKGQTQNRWEIKAHAVEAFYRDMSHWCIFLSDPSIYGWKDNCNTIPPIETNIEDVELTREQENLIYEKTGRLVADKLGGIESRSVLAQIAKGWYKGRRIRSNKPGRIRGMVERWPDESTIIWCIHNPEQEILTELFGDMAVSIEGKTPYADRVRLIREFQQGKRKVLISKPKVLGFGLNLQIATRMIFSGIDDSWEKYYQAIKRANRVGSTKPLKVYIPITEIERPFIENVLRKAERVEEDTRIQERLFAKMMRGG